MNGLRKMLSSPLAVSRRRRFMVIRVFPEKTRALLASVDEHNAVRVEMSRSWRRGAEPPRDVAALAKIPVVVALHPLLAYTHIEKLKIPRRKTDPPVTKLELGNTLAHIVEKTATEERIRAAEVLGVEELDAVFLDAYVEPFSVDGEAAGNPVGKRGGDVETRFHGTFAPRDVFNELNAVIHSGRDFFVTEIGKAELMLATYAVGTPTRVVRIERERSRHFTLRTQPRGRAPLFSEGELDRGSDAPVAALMNVWGISAAAAREVYAAYVRNECSEHMNTFFKRLFRKEWDRLLKRMRSAGLHGDVYAVSDEPLPVALPHKSTGMHILEFPMGRIAEAAGYACAESEKRTRRNRAALAPLLEFLLFRGDRGIHKFMKRRIHWITE